MKKATTITFLIVLVCTLYSQQGNVVSTQVDTGYFITHTREELIGKLIDLPCGIKADDPVKVILQKIKTFLVAFVPGNEFSDDVYAKAANIQAVTESDQSWLTVMVRSSQLIIIHRSRSTDRTFMLR
jgi:hypothetical protein